MPLPIYLFFDECIYNKFCLVGVSESDTKYLLCQKKKESESEILV